MKTALLLWAVVLAARAAEPALSVSLNASTQRIIEAGWPVLLTVHLRNEFDEALMIQPAGTGWVREIRVTAAKSPSPPAVLRFQPAVPPPAAALRLPASSSVRFDMVLPAAMSQALAQGAYEIRAEMAVPAGAGWKGKVRSQPVWLQVAAPGKAGADAQREHALTRARIATLARRYEEAIQILKTFLQSNRDDVHLIRTIGEIYETSGDDVRAYVYISRAIQLNGEDSAQTGAEEDRGLSAIHSRLVRKLLLSPAGAGAAKP